METKLKLLRRQGKFISNSSLDTMMKKYNLQWSFVETEPHKAVSTELVVRVNGSSREIANLIGTTLWEEVK
jgi:hypothetical protein